MVLPPTEAVLGVAGKEMECDMVVQRLPLRFAAPVGRDVSQSRTLHIQADGLT